MEYLKSSKKAMKWNKFVAWRQRNDQSVTQKRRLITLFEKIIRQYLWVSTSKKKNKYALVSSHSTNVG